ncbi:hypothetical protein J2X65_003533 [Ancylobacter sp. 3268]|uniref:hypothetical protein n=1 Tax=Ancylobacter sp. 3268 TaxID=2817752 RepID=UPI002865F7F6|nr:hypothetical protein [Ancylobacter sp. 3268]MDR6954165.1 hypothetical protein [Ancylobacter sp. 3268]
MDEHDSRTSDALRRAKNAHARHFGRLNGLVARVCTGTDRRLPGARHYPKRFIRVEDQESGAITDWAFHRPRLEKIAERPPSGAEA